MNEIVFDGVPFTVTFNIRDKGKEQYQYLIEFNENKTPGLSNTVASNLLRSDQVSYDDSIRNPEEKVKQISSTNSDSKQLSAENPDIRYSAGAKTDKAVQAMLETENHKLQEDVAKLKDLLKLQGVETGGTKFLESSVLAAARYLKKNSGTSGNTKELSKMLNDFYEYIAAHRLEVLMRDRGVSA